MGIRDSVYHVLVLAIAVYRYLPNVYNAHLPTTSITQPASSTALHPTTHPSKPARHAPQAAPPAQMPHPAKLAPSPSSSTTTPASSPAHHPHTSTTSPTHPPIPSYPSNVNHAHHRNASSVMLVLLYVLCVLVGCTCLGVVVGRVVPLACLGMGWCVRVVGLGVWRVCLWGCVSSVPISML